MALSKIQDTYKLSLCHVNYDMYKKYKTVFKNEVNIQLELSMLVNQYMFDRIVSREKANADQ